MISKNENDNILETKKIQLNIFFVLDLTFRYNITSKWMLITKCSYHLIFLDPTLKTRIEHSHIKLWTNKMRTRKENLAFKEIVASTVEGNCEHSHWSADQNWFHLFNWTFVMFPIVLQLQRSSTSSGLWAIPHDLYWSLSQCSC